jgi:polyisoprenoid-binding protein YceI
VTVQGDLTIAGTTKPVVTALLDRADTSRRVAPGRVRSSLALTPS